MIEKMKMVCVVSSVSRKDEMLDGLRSLGSYIWQKRKVRTVQLQNVLQRFPRQLPL